MGPKEARAIKKVLWSITAATLILTLTGCAGTAGPVQSENCPPQPAAVTTPELSALSTKAIESEPVSFSASNKLPVGDSPEDSAASEEPTPSPEPPAKPSASPVPDTALAPVPRENQAPAVEETPPPASAESTFSIDHWIGYAQNYARDTGLNLDATAVDCWDNPITAGAHCTCLERDIQSRLNRYVRDESITDVWIWAEPRSDGSYDLYIGYA